MDLQVGTHDDEKIWPGIELGFEKICVLEGLLGGMDGAGADDDEETIVTACEDAGSAVACGRDCLLCIGGGDDLMAEKSRLEERIVLGDGERGSRREKSTYANDTTVLDVLLDAGGVIKVGEGRYVVHVVLCRNSWEQLDGPERDGREEIPNLNGGWAFKADCAAISKAAVQDLAKPSPLHPWPNLFSVTCMHPIQLVPVPAFCVKSSAHGTKVFVNIAWDSNVPPHVPVVVSDARDDTDKGTSTPISSQSRCNLTPQPANLLSCLTASTTNHSSLALALTPISSSA